MNHMQTRRYEMLVRIREFGTAHADLFPESSLARQAFAAVAEAVQQLNEHTVTKLSAAQGTTTKAKARAALLDCVEAVGQTGRVIAEHTPGLEEKFVVPVLPSDQALLMTARVFAAAAEPLKDAFFAREMPKTFVADLEDAIARFEGAIHARDAGKGERVAARERIQAALNSGLAATGALDAMVANRLRDDPATIAVWKRNRKVSYPPRPHAAEDAPAPAPSTPAATGEAPGQAPNAASPAPTAGEALEPAKVA